MRGAAILVALALAGCAELQSAGLSPEADAEPEATAEEVAAPAATAAPGPSEPAAAAESTLPRPQAAAGDVPEIYMALQPDPAGPTSVVFAIDHSRDNTPSDEPAIRLTPDSGDCNPQQLRRYTFPPESAAAPVFGPDEIARGMTARELPNAMAVAVTAEMLRRGLITEPAQSQPQNVCTRKLWEMLVISESAGAG